MEKEINDTTNTREDRKTGKISSMTTSTTHRMTTSLTSTMKSGLEIERGNNNDNNNTQGSFEKTDGSLHSDVQEQEQEQMMVEHVTGEADAIDTSVQDLSMPRQKRFKIDDSDINTTDITTKGKEGKEEQQKRQEIARKEAALADFIQQLNKERERDVNKDKGKEKDNKDQNTTTNTKEIFSKLLDSIYENGNQNQTELLTWEEIALTLYEGRGEEDTPQFSNAIKELEKEKMAKIFGKSVMKYLFVDDTFEVYTETCNIFSLEEFLANEQYSKDTIEAEARACRGNRSHNKVENDHQENGNRARYQRITMSTAQAKPKYLKRMEKKRKADMLRVKDFVSNRLQQMKQ